MRDRDAQYSDRYDREPDRYRGFRDRHAADERGFAERATDEARSWFGDDEAARRRRMDEERHRGHEERSGWGDDRAYSSDREYGSREYGVAPRTAGGSGERNLDVHGDRFRQHRDREWRTWRDEPDWSRRESMTNRGATAGGAGYAPHRESAPFRDYDQGYARSRVVSYGPSGRQDAGQEPWAREGVQARGRYAGRGPRGYQRSDERIREDLNERLTAHDMIDATDIECRVQNGEVTLTGFVDSRAAKRAAEDLAEDVSGVREVHNQLRIRSHAGEEGLGRTSVLGLTESETQTPAVARAAAQATSSDRSRTRS
jgi:osmotically-inducible protein OsmY